MREQLTPESGFVNPMVLSTGLAFQAAPVYVQRQIIQSDWNKDDSH
jgi:hypothetical protein